MSRILDPDGYVERKGDVSFVIEKVYHAEHGQYEVNEAIKNNQPIPEPTPSDQRVMLISEEMIEAVGKFFDQDQEFRQEFPHLDERQQMSPPFIWWYHYRRTLDISRLRSRQRRLVSKLTSWIDQTYGSLYDEIDALFSARLVSQESLQYLIRPGTVLLSDDGKIPRGYLATSHPLATSQPRLNLHADQGESRQSWSIQVRTLEYIGELAWLDDTLDISIEARQAEMAITSLKFVPIQYASEELRQRLAIRAQQTFWGCRHGQLVSYEPINLENKSVVGYERIHSITTNPILRYSSDISQYPRAKDS